MNCLAMWMDFWQSFLCKDTSNLRFNMFDNHFDYKNYATLYTVDSTGKTRIWLIQQDGAKFRTVSGVKNSANLVTAEWTVCEPKNEGKSNETSGEEQARKEISAKYKKQLKTGYSETESGAAKGTRYVEPQLAKSYSDYQDKIDFSKQDWLIQCKFNGARCIATKDGLKTRTGEQFVSIPHISESLKPFFEKFPNAVLDGELFSYENREKLNELMKLVRKSVNATTEDLQRSKEIVKYYIYDGFDFTPETQESAPYSVRKAWIDKNVVGKYDYIEEVKSYPIKGQQDLDKQYDRFLDDKQEGGILRRNDTGYERKRTKALLKIKPFEDSEFKILDIKEGNGNWAGAGKIITLEFGDSSFNATLKGTYEEGVELLQNKKDWIGKEVTISYNGVTGKTGCPNFAQFNYANSLKS